MTSKDFHIPKVKYTLYIISLNPGGPRFLWFTILSVLCDNIIGGGTLVNFCEVLYKLY